MSRDRFKAVDDQLDAQTNAIVSAHERDDGIEDRLELVEGKLRTNQVETAVERGLPPDLVTAESNVWKRLTLTHTRWPDVDARLERVAALEQRRAEKARALAELHDREVSEPRAHADRLATWQLEGEQGERPESELPAIRLAIRERQEEIEGLDRAVTRELNELVAYWNKHRSRLVKDAESHRDEKQRAYLDKIAEAEQARAELYTAERACVLAHTYPSQEAMQEVPDTLAGGRKQPLQAMGLNGPVAPGPVFEALRADAEWLATAATPEQKALMGQGRDPRQPPNTGWADTPEARAERDKKTAQWLNSR